MTQDTTQQKKFYNPNKTNIMETWQMQLNNEPEVIWAWCSSDLCMERRDFEYIKDRGWFCPYCGKQNFEIPYKPRSAIYDVAERYLKDNPEE